MTYDVISVPMNHTASSSQIRSLTEVETPVPSSSQSRQNMDTQPPPYNPQYNPYQDTNPHTAAIDPYAGKQLDYPAPPPPYQQPLGNQLPYEAGGPQTDAQNTPFSSYGPAVPMNDHLVPMETGQQGTSTESEENTFKFTEKSIRLGFIKKVFTLLFFQLLLTAGLMCIFIFVEPVKEYVLRNDWVYITSICLTIICTTVFAFVTKLRRMWPVNFICLIIITLLMSTMLGSIACSMEVDEILISVGIVAAVVAVCAILGFQKKFDFTPLVGFVCMFGMCLLAFAFLCIFFYNEVMTIVYCTLGALLFALWLLLDIQMILGGKHKLQFDPEDYIGGALTLYVDIIYMLMMIFFIFKAT